jgi:hypothetical protein
MKEIQTTLTAFQTRSLGSALGIWRDKKGSFEVRRQTPEHVVFIDATPQQSQEDEKNEKPLTDRSARVWVPIIVKIDPRNDCTRGLLHCDLNNILHQHYTSLTQNSENASSICLTHFSSVHLVSACCTSVVLIIKNVCSRQIPQQLKSWSKD